MDIRTLLGITTSLTMLPVLAAILFIVFMHKKEFLEKAGFGKPEVGMILVGSLFGLFADIPIIVSNGSLLNINLGGALIPIIVSADLIYKRKINIIKVSAGTAVIAASAYYFSRFVPNLGIVSEFPQYLIPSGLAIFLALVLERGYTRISFAYSTGVLGVLIGADLVRIPMLIEEGILGSIGGAGIMDLVYLSGLIATLPLISIYYFKEPYTERSHPLDISRKMIDEGRYRDSIKYDMIAVNRELKKAANMFYRQLNRFRGEVSFNPTKILQYLGMHPYIIKDYHFLKDMDDGLDKKKAEKSLATAQLLTHALKTRINDYYGSLGRRILAYVMDLIILFLPFALFFFYISRLPFFRENISFTVFVAIVSLAISIQFIYFTIMEWKFGASFGKMALGLRVVSDDMEDINFIQSAARNSARYADILLMFYMISIILILRSPESKRIGDSIAETRIVKI